MYCSLDTQQKSTIRAILTIVFMCHYGKTLVKYIGGVISNVIAFNMIGRDFENQSDQTKDYKIGVCCFFAKHTTLRSNIKYYLTLNQDNVFKRSDMPFCGLLFQSSSIKILQRPVLVCAVWRLFSLGTTVIGTNNHHSQFYLMEHNSDFILYRKYVLVYDNN